MINLKKTLINIFFVSFCLISCSNGETLPEKDTTLVSTEMQKEISLLKAEIDSYKQNINAYLKENSNLQNELKKANENLKAAEIIIIELSKSKICSGLSSLLIFSFIFSRKVIISLMKS